MPDPVPTPSAVGSGVTCIDVFWSGPDNLRGSIDNKAYFLTYRGGSFDVSVDVGTNMSLSLNDLTPDVEYMIEVLVVDKCRSEIFVVFATGEGIQWSFKQQYYSSGCLVMAKSSFPRICAAYQHINDSYTWIGRCTCQHIFSFHSGIICMHRNLRNKCPNLVVFFLLWMHGCVNDEVTK